MKKDKMMWIGSKCEQSNENLLSIEKPAKEDRSCFYVIMMTNTHLNNN